MLVSAEKIAAAARDLLQGVVREPARLARRAHAPRPVATASPAQSTSAPAAGRNRRDRRRARHHALRRPHHQLRQDSSRWVREDGATRDPGRAGRRDRDRQGRRRDRGPRRRHLADLATTSGTTVKMGEAIGVSARVNNRPRRQLALHPRGSSASTPTALRPATSTAAPATRLTRPRPRSAPPPKASSTARRPARHRPTHEIPARPHRRPHGRRLRQSSTPSLGRARRSGLQRPRLRHLGSRRPRHRADADAGRGTATYQRPPPARPGQPAGPGARRPSSAACAAPRSASSASAASASPPRCRAKAFDMESSSTTRTLPNGVEIAIGCERVHSLDGLMAVADVLSIHAPLSDETRGMIDAEALAAPSPAWSWSTPPAARSSISTRCTTRCRGGRIAGAALDVLPQEPPMAAAGPSADLLRALQDRAPYCRTGSSPARTPRSTAPTQSATCAARWSSGAALPARRPPDQLRQPGAPAPADAMNSAGAQL